MSSEADRKEIVVVGGGLSGLVSTLALHQSIRKTDRITLIAPSEIVKDKRTTAMLMPAVRMLRDFGAWENLTELSAALKTMRIVDAGDRLITAPTVEFKSSEIDAEAFGYNVPNHAAVEIFRKVIEGLNNVSLIDAKAIAFEPKDNRLSLNNGSKIEADLFVAADGRNSLLRDEASISTRSRDYPQTALVTTFSHSLPHDGVSTEIHMRTGPFTQVPLPSTDSNTFRSSLVWVVEPGEVEHLKSHSRDDLARMIEGKLQSSLGKVVVESDLQSFPLSLMTAKRFAAKNVALVGEAAHVLPPIGAQGFNLGVSDIQVLSRLVSQELSVESVCAEYDRKRRAEVFTKTGGVDLLNRSLLSGFLPLQLGRSAALGFLSESSSARRVLMAGIMNGPKSLFKRESVAKTA